MANEGRLQNGDISYVLRGSISKRSSPKANRQVEKAAKQKEPLVSTPMTPAFFRFLASFKIPTPAAEQMPDNGEAYGSNTSSNIAQIKSREERLSGSTKSSAGSWIAAASTSQNSSPDVSKRNDSTSDSYSESTYSQVSDISSDVRSQRSTNTTSSDSDNSRFFQEAIQINGNARTPALTAANCVTDDDEVEARRVLMLMKVILFLRQNYTTIFIYSPSIVTPQGKATGSRSSCHRTLLGSDGSLQARKRISFSPVTLLFSAIAEKSFEEAKVILDTEDVDVNTQSPSGQSLLHIAAGNADLKCIELLLQSGSKVNIKDLNAWTPLHAAIRRGNWKSAIVLIEAGADIAEYAQNRIREYQSVLKMSRNCYRVDEIFV